MSALKNRVTLLLCALCCSSLLWRGTYLSGQTPSQSTNPRRQVQVLPVSGNIYMIVGGGSNITASIGRDGVLLVDSGTAEMSEQVLETVKQLSSAIAGPTPLTPCVGLRCGDASAFGWSSPAINGIIGSPAPPK